ncbi:PKS-NRPS hybrid synthetase CHGG_01239-like [Camellia sinensis]|uniref:PKS-NRPS hybrid synthetase CHGG_01239-like n=1 Tax=Camellia sinensis TaxID=4442 RepID=UPI001036B88C|nr:PKS-NRPS hybrid synthetase CHGG_01239-like [Camellia sinensis]
MTVTDLFWAHPVSLDLLRTFPRVLIMDCTYKTNRYRLPLLEIVGVTSTHMTFSVTIAYLQTERVDNYAWALQTLRDLMDDSVLPEVIVTDRELALMNAIDNTFPNARHLLCRWHINKNVLTKCKKMFETKEKWDKFNTAWNYLILSSTEEEYNDHLATLHKDFSNYPEAIKYVTVSWLNPYQEKFIAVHTDMCMHFGNVTTNRVESAHARLKRQLGSSQTTFEVSFEKIHCLLELQHIQVKASFEKSLTTVQHQFKPSQFRELRGNVSICAFEYVLAESKRSNSVGIDVATCGCVLRRTHGLPCAHEIADYTRQGRPIPLSSILEQKLELTCIPELELILKRFEESDIATQLDMLKKLREIANPASTFLIEPDVKPNLRRGHKKIDISCRRDPCAFELVDDEHDSQSTLASSQSKKKRASKVHEKKRNVKTKAYRTRTSLPNAYVAGFPPMLIPFIKLMKDVDGDGNCGFRAIAGLFGLGENDWVQVRRDLLLELNNHRDEYVVLYGSHERVKELTHILLYFENSAGFDRWMTMPDMGHLIASFYNVVLYHLSLQQCLTFLPLRAPPVTLADRREIAIGFVNENHFVQVFLEADHPVPPIAVLWRVFHHPCASEWENAYVSRIQKFKDNIGPTVATRETFDVVDID